MLIYRDQAAIITGLKIQLRLRSFKDERGKKLRNYMQINGASDRLD